MPHNTVTREGVRIVVLFFFSVLESCNLFEIPHKHLNNWKFNMSSDHYHVSTDKEKCLQQKNKYIKREDSTPVLDSLSD